MKKISILGICAVASIGAFAQNGLVKEVERQMKSAPDQYPANLETLKPAFTNPETANEAYPYFVAGKGGYDYFDQLEGFKAIGREVDDKSMGHALINSYGYLKQALKNDTVVDAKGKVKTKYSKDAIKLINIHYNDYDKAARYMWGAQDYDGAYEAWQIFIDAPHDPILGENAPKALHDTIVAEIYYNQALAAWQSNRLEDAIKSFDNALNMGYNKQQLFDYAIAVAYNMQNPDLMAKYAELAYPLYGSKDSKYVGYIINAKIKHEQFEEAQKMLEDYIKQDPDNGQLYYVLGILFDSQNQFDKALTNYQKAVDLDPENAQALYQLGRQICNQAYTLDDEASKNLDTAEYNKARTEQVNPLFLKAAPYLEKAYKIDPDNTRDALSFLRNIYYNVGDAENLHRIEEEMKY